MGFNDAELHAVCSLSELVSGLGEQCMDWLPASAVEACLIPRIQSWSA